DDLTNSTMNGKEITDSFNASMNTTEAQVQLFNNEMSATANELKTALLPAFQGLAPVIVDITKWGVDLVRKLTGSKDVEAQKRAFASQWNAMNAVGALRSAS